MKRAVNVTITDANIKVAAERASISATNDLTIENSGIYREDSNESLSISAYGDEVSDLVLKGSETNATGVFSLGNMTIDNTNLNVVPSKSDQAKIDEGYYEKDGMVPWIVTAVQAMKGITLKGEANGTVETYTSENGTTWHYLSTGEDYKVELRASATPAYWGTNKGMPATSDTTMPMVMGLSIVAACAAAFTVFSARSRKAEGKHVK